MEFERLGSITESSFWVIIDRYAVQIKGDTVAQVRFRRLEGRVKRIDDEITYTSKTDCFDNGRIRIQAVTNGVIFRKSDDKDNKCMEIVVDENDVDRVGIPDIWFVKERYTRESRIDTVKQYVAELIVQRSSKLLVYAFPGSGKTTFMNKLTSSVGYKAIDTDDFLKKLELKSDERKYHEIAFHTATFYNASTPNILLTNFHSDLFLANMRKVGFTLIGVKLSDELWRKRFNEREDLRKMNSPWEQWRSEVDYSKFDIIVNDFNEIEDMVFRPLQIQSYGNPVGKEVVLTTSPTPLGFDTGYYTRRSIMMWVGRLKRRYIGLGSEIEEVLTGDELGIDAEYYGYPESNPFDKKGADALNRINRENIFNVKGEENDIGVALWSISNIDNGSIDDILNNIQFENAVLMFPCLETAGKLPYGYGDNYLWKQALFTSRGSRLYRDYVVSANAILKHSKWVCYELGDFLNTINHQIDGKYIGPKGRYFVSRNSYMMNLWMIVVSKQLMSFLQYQTWQNTQTYKVRLITIPIRRVFAVGTDSLHAMRRLSMKLLYKKSVTVKDLLGNRVNGYIMMGDSVSNEKRKYIAVSGHLMNLLLCSTEMLVDFKRYFDTIEENVRIYSSNSKLGAELKMLLGKQLLAEDNERENMKRLWHSYYDFEIAVGAYILLCKALRFNFNARGVRYSLRRLNDIRRKYPRFNEMGWQALQYSKE